MISVLLLVTAAAAGILLLLAKVIWTAGRRRGQREGSTDGYRRCYRELNGVWPESPPRRPGMVEYKPTYHGEAEQ